MCLSCGCGKPNDRHGDDRHITLDDLKAAGDASSISTEKAAENIKLGLNQPANS